MPHDVGVIVGLAAGVVHSGNDGGRIRTCERSLHSVIAFRRIDYNECFASPKTHSFEATR